MITIKHIAERLNLSVSTVGRALTDHPRISRETKDRVREVADELGYVANRAARVMRGGSSHLVGLLVPDIRSTFYSMVAQMLSKCVEADGFHLALSITDDDRDTEMQQVRELVSARVAGIVLIPSANPRRETIAMLRMVPHVQVLRRIPSLGDCFGMDDERAILDATNHLLQLGHRRIAYVGDLIFSTGRIRFDGFRRACAEAGCAVDESLVELGPPNEQFGGEAIARLLAKPSPPTAVLTTSVQVTLGAAQQLTAMKIAVPQQLSIVGFGDGSWQQWWGPGLTTLRLPAEELATSCGLWFLHAVRTERLAGEKDPHVAISPMTLIKRGSTASV
ncbi:MAG TPA: LacI family DNA-binding transcriptional regulator [Magnetospirillaceae bacterium]|jgi:LacI family transcriptional regulator